MMRIVLGVIAGFFAWVLLWFGGETVLSAVWPQGFGIHQRAFQEAIANGVPYTANATMLVAHIVLGSAVTVISGYFAALIAAENKRAPLILGVMLLALGLLKATMSWQYVPIWYHVLFTALLVPLTLLGGRMKTAPRPALR